MVFAMGLFDFGVSAFKLLCKMQEYKKMRQSRPAKRDGAHLAAGRRRKWLRMGSESLTLPPRKKQRKARCLP